jgi:TonB family protein
MRGRIWVLVPLIAFTLVSCSSSGHPSNPPTRRETRDDAADAVPRCAKIEAPKLIRRAEPSYPDEVRKKGVRGTVIMKAALTEEGKLENIQVSSSPDSKLSELAVEAFQKWRYKPATCAGKPVPVYITSTMSFDPNK